MAALTVQVISLGLSGGTYSGLTPAAAVAASGGGDTFKNDGHTFLCVINGGGSSITATVAASFNCSDGHDHDKAVSVPAAGERWFGPFETFKHNDANDNCAVTYSGVTSVTVRVFRLHQKGF